jgi:Fe-S-cluster-containing dehydrogenase component
LSSEAQKVSAGKRLVVDIDQCTGCKCCAVACSYVKAGVYDADSGCIFVVKMEESGMDCPVFCQQCREPRCVESCLFGALSKRPEDGLVVIDQRKCTACGMCVMACPYGAISAAPLGNPQGSIILKCDQCGGAPECVQWCDTHALKYVDASDKQAVDLSAENVLLAKKRFELDFNCSLWRLRMGDQKLKDRKPRVVK